MRPSNASMSFCFTLEKTLYDSSRNYFCIKRHMYILFEFVVDIFGLFLFLKALDFGSDIFCLLGVRLVLFTKSFKYGGLDFELLEDLGHVN